MPGAKDPCCGHSQPRPDIVVATSASITTRLSHSPRLHRLTVPFDRHLLDRVVEEVVQIFGLFGVHDVVGVGGRAGRVQLLAQVHVVGDRRGEGRQDLEVALSILARSGQQHHDPRIAATIMGPTNAGPTMVRLRSNTASAHPNPMPAARPKVVPIAPRLNSTLANPASLVVRSEVMNANTPTATKADSPSPPESRELERPQADARADPVGDLRQLESADDLTAQDAGEQDDGQVQQRGLGAHEPKEAAWVNRGSRGLARLAAMSARASRGAAS